MKKYILITLGITAVAFIAGRLTSTPGSSEQPTPGPFSSESNPQVWTCSMHPQIQQPSPGDCPICGMDLIPLTRDSDDPGPRAMRMSESAMALADIQTVKVSRQWVTRETRLVGRLEVDETLERNLSARFPARLDRLYVNYEGIPVNTGDHLAKVYSPELFAAQSELLTAHQHDPKSAMTRAAREKLRLWDLLPKQIDEIISQGVASERMDILAPTGGIVISKHVKEGDYLRTGQAMFRIADLKALWLSMEAYESDLSWLRYGQAVAFTVEAFPGKSFEGRISFIEPEVDRKTRTVHIRVNVPNADGILKPGMFARGVVSTQLAQNGRVHAPDVSGKWISPMHPEIIKDQPGRCDVCGMALVPTESLGFAPPTEAEPPLVVPASAVLRTGTRSVVYIRTPDTEKPTFEGREIVIGTRAGDFFVVMEGLEDGEEVVSNGAFKIDSALQIVAKPSMMNPLPEKPAMLQITLEHDAAAALLPGYLSLQSALASDKLEASKAAVKQMMEVSGHGGALATTLHHMLDASELDAMRRPHFEILSNAMVDAVSKKPDAFSGLYLMHCPMVYDDRGADWLQDKDELLNPYFGDMMLHCGEQKKHFGSSTTRERRHDH